jgi:hypothetical protein
MSEYAVTCISDSQEGFELEIRFTDHFNTRPVTTLNYSAMATFHTLQITIACVKSFQCVFTSRFQVTDYKNGDSTAPTKSSFHCFSYNWLLTTDCWLISKLVSVITSRLGPYRKHCFSVAVQLFPWENIWEVFTQQGLLYICLLRICYLAAYVVSLFISRSLPSNGSYTFCMYCVTKFIVRKIKIREFPKSFCIDFISILTGKLFIVLEWCWREFFFQTNSCTCLSHSSGRAIS